MYVYNRAELIQQFPSTQYPGTGCSCLLNEAIREILSGAIGKLASEAIQCRVSGTSGGLVPIHVS